MSSSKRSRNNEDAEKMVKMAKDINSHYKLVDRVDEKLLSQLSWTAGGLFPPLATAVGGLVAQEALISLTGKFSPLRQWVRKRKEWGERERERISFFAYELQYFSPAVSGCY